MRVQDDHPFGRGDSDLRGSVIEPSPADSDPFSSRHSTRSESSDRPWLPDPKDDCFTPTTLRLIWIDRAARQLRAYTDRLSVPLALAAREFVERRLWQVFGCARAEDHCRERYGRHGRWLRDLATLGRALDRLPGLERALTGDDGGPPLGRTFAVRLARVATARSASAWIRLGRTVSYREFSDAVRRARKHESEWPVDPDESGVKPGVKPGVDPGDESCRSDGSGLRGRSPSSPPDALDPEDVPDPDAPRSEVRLFVPCALRVAFDDVLTLHRAVSGREVTVTDFVQALVAESMTGPAPTDVDRMTLRRGRSAAEIERELSRLNDDWSWLDRVEIPTEPPRRPRDREFDRLVRQATQLLESLSRTSGAVPGTPAGLDLRIRELILLENPVERLLGRMLRYMRNKRGWQSLRFRGVGQYASERLALGRRTAQDRSHAAAVLRDLPLLREAYENDRIGLEAVLLVARVIAPGPVPSGIERAWVERAAEVSIKRLRDEVRVAQNDVLLRGSWTPRRPLTDEEWQQSQELHPGTTQRRFADLAGAVNLDGPVSIGTILSLRLDELLADDFLAAIEHRRQGLADLARTFSVESAGSDIVTDARRRGATPLSALAACRLAARGAFVANHRAVQCEMPLTTEVAAKMLSRGRTLPGWLGLMGLLEEYVATWDDPTAGHDVRHAEIHGRHGFRCAGPLCTGRRNLEGHHLGYLSRGGSDAPDNLVTLCRFHHKRGEHGGLASCSGRAPLGIRWRLGREDVAEWYLNERKLSRPDAAFGEPAA